MISKQYNASDLASIKVEQAHKRALERITARVDFIQFLPLHSASATSSSSSAIPWTSIAAGVSIGVISNIARVASVFGCQELEAFGSGCAGVVGNILHAQYIAMMAVFAYVFFGETMTTVELIGACVIGGAVIGVTGVKALRQRGVEKRGASDEEEEFGKRMMDIKRRMGSGEEEREEQEEEEEEPFSVNKMTDAPAEKVPLLATG